MELVEFTEFLVKSLVEDKDLVKVSEFNAEEDISILEILVPTKEVGKLIGKNGRVCSAIRTVIQAYAAVNHLPKVKINIDGF